MDNVYVPSTWRRLFAHLIDQVIRMAFYLPFAKAFFLLLFTEDEVNVSLLQLFLLFMVPAVYEFVFLVLMQATPGKWLLGLKVVPFSNAQEKLDWQQCVLRPLTERLTLFFSWALYATAFFRYDRTHAADWVAETRVVQFVPRQSRARIRGILGTFLVLIYLYDGYVTSRDLIEVIDWQNHQVDLRDVINMDQMGDVIDVYESGDED